MNYPKPFKTISELLEILKNRGLIINDDKFASDFLYNVNYYRLSAYFIPFYAVIPEIPGLFFTTRRVEKTSPGLFRNKWRTLWKGAAAGGEWMKGAINRPLNFPIA